jgi:DNA modification methylase
MKGIDMGRQETGQREDGWHRVARDATCATDAYALFLGDANEVLKRLPPDCVDTCLTSPPYWQARDYQHPDQLGLESDVDSYVARLVSILGEVRRVLSDRGTVWLNLGDTYFNGAATVDGRPPRKGWKRNKKLALVPFRVAIALEDDGWWVRNTMVWHKPNAMPASVRDRLANTWEPVFLLAKSEDYFFDLDPIRLPHRTSDLVERRRAERGTANGKAKGQAELRRWLNSPRHRSTIDGVRQIARRPNAPAAIELAAYLRRGIELEGVSIEWVAAELGEPFERVRHYFRTDEIGSRLPPPETWLRLKSLLQLDSEYDDAMTVEVGDNIFRNHPNGRNPGDFASIAASTRSKYHFATMPDQLARRTLAATLPQGGVCLDPFMGSGTTGNVAIRLGGRFVGADVRREYIDEFVAEAGNITSALPSAL